MKMDMTITGIADVNRVLAEIAPKEAKNLIRATAQDIASQLAKTAKVNAPGTKKGDLQKGIKAKRERGDRKTVHSTVRSAEFYWRFLEYGQGPDGVEHAFMLRALQAMRPNMDQVYLEAFTRKLVARLARERKKRGG